MADVRMGVAGELERCVSYDKTGDNSFLSVRAREARSFAQGIVDCLPALAGAIADAVDEETFLIVTDSSLTAHDYYHTLAEAQAMMWRQ